MGSSSVLDFLAALVDINSNESSLRFFCLSFIYAGRLSQKAVAIYGVDWTLTRLDRCFTCLNFDICMWNASRLHVKQEKTDDDGKITSMRDGHDNMCKFIRKGLAW